MRSVTVWESGVLFRGMASRSVDFSIVAWNVVHVVLHMANEVTQIPG